MQVEGPQEVIEILHHCMQDFLPTGVEMLTAIEPTPDVSISVILRPS